MNYIWTQTPHDMVNEILSYGDPAVFEKFKLVMEQIELLKRKFQILRKDHLTCWYRHPETNFVYYVLRCCFIQKELNRRAAKRMRLSVSK